MNREDIKKMENTEDGLERPESGGEEAAAEEEASQNIYKMAALANTIKSLQDKVDALSQHILGGGWPTS